jgi:hypothetical protein
MESKIHLLTFADNLNGNDYTRHAQQLIKDATSYNIFSSIRGLTAVDLFKYTEFHKHLLFISENKKGFGYWLWKPFLIWKTLEELPEGDLLVYLDAGTKLSLEGKSRFMNYLEIQRKDKFNNLFFEQLFPISKWCKMDAIHFLDAYDLAQNNIKEVLPGILFTCNNLHNRFLFKLCYDTCSNYQLINDSPSIKQNLPEFVEHRHDQSIFSIITRKFSPSSIYSGLIHELTYDVNKVSPILIRGLLQKQNKVYLFWPNDEPFPKERTFAFDDLIQNVGGEIVFVTFKNIDKYILQEYPLHNAYKYLSSAHKSDYLGAYFMHHFGGGYSDILKTSGSWMPCHSQLATSDKWICGYKENTTIGKSAFICKSKTPFTSEWLQSLNSMLDSKLDSFKNTYPVQFEFDQIFNAVCSKYKDKLLDTLPSVKYF